MKNLVASGFPFLVLASCLLAGCRPPPLMSYPRFWDHPTSRPDDADLAGTYKVASLRLPDELIASVRQKDSTITLNADHTAVFTTFAVFDTPGETVLCRLSGSAVWQSGDGIESGGQWTVVFDHFQPAEKLAGRDCEDSTWDILVLGRHSPYRLYTIVGDPDSDTGVEYGRIGF